MPIERSRRPGSRRRIKITGAAPSTCLDRGGGNAAAGCALRNVRSVVAQQTTCQRFSAIDPLVEAEAVAVQL